MNTQQTETTQYVKEGNILTTIFLSNIKHNCNSFTFTASLTHHSLNKLKETANSVFIRLDCNFSHAHVPSKATEPRSGVQVVNANTPLVLWTLRLAWLHQKDH